MKEFETKNLKKIKKKFNEKKMLWNYFEQFQQKIHILYNSDFKKINVFEFENEFRTYDTFTITQKVL